MRDAAPTIADGGAMSAAPDADATWAAGARAALARTDAALAVAFDRGDDVDRLVAMRAGAVDDLIRQAWARCVPAGTGASLHAVGGYGRGELFPQSDIDLLVLADDTAQQRHGDARFGSPLSIGLQTTGVPITESWDAAKNQQHSKLQEHRAHSPKFWL